MFKARPRPFPKNPSARRGAREGTRNTGPTFRPRGQEGGQGERAEHGKSGDRFPPPDPPPQQGSTKVPGLPASISDSLALYRVPVAWEELVSEHGRGGKKARTFLMAFLGKILLLDEGNAAG